MAGLWFGIFSSRGGERQGRYPPAPPRGPPLRTPHFVANRVISVMQGPPRRGSPAARLPNAAAEGGGRVGQRAVWAGVSLLFPDGGLRWQPVACGGRRQRCFSWLGGGWAWCGRGLRGTPPRPLGRPSHGVAARGSAWRRACGRPGSARPRAAEVSAEAPAAAGPGRVGRVFIPVVVAVTASGECGSERRSSLTHPAFPPPLPTRHLGPTTARCRASLVTCAAPFARCPPPPPPRPPHDSPRRCY